MIECKKNKFLEKKNNKPEIRNIYQNKLSPIITNNIMKTGSTIPREWLMRKEFVGKVISLIPDQDL